MNTRSRWQLVVACLGCLLVGPHGLAATVYLDLSLDPGVPGCVDCTLSGPGTWNLFASTGFDNNGIAAYSIPLENVLTIDHQSPYLTVAQPDFRPAGFSYLRSGNSATTLVASQDILTPTPHIIYDFGQTASDFASHGAIPLGIPNFEDQTSWQAPLLLAEGTYDQGAFSLPGITADSDELGVFVFSSIFGGLETEEADLILDHSAHSPLLDAEITVVGGDFATYGFAAPFEPTPYDTIWQIANFEGPGKNYDPYLNYDFQYADGAGFEWDTTGSALGTYQALIQFGKVYSSSIKYYGTLTIHLVPEPASASLLGLGAVGLMGAFRRGRRAGMIRQSR